MLYPKDNIDQNRNIKDKKTNDIFKVIQDEINIDNICISNTKKQIIKEILKNEDLQGRWLNLWNILRLSWYFWDAKDIIKLSIENNVKWIYKISIESNEFDKLKTHIELCNNEIKIDMVKLNKSIVNNGIGTKNIINLIYFAEKFWFKKIYCIAVKTKTKDLGKEYKNRGYFFFPKLWFLVSEIDNKEPNIMKKIKKDPRFFDISSINELLMIKDEGWNRIWLDFWKKIWDSSLMEFDLQEWSKSMEILHSYLENKGLLNN